MASSVKIGTNSVCPGCETVPQSSECTTCFICKSHYHAVCETLGDKTLGTKTMVKSFVLKSTKSNFKFFCDVCLTNLEQNLVDAETQAMNIMSAKMNSVETKLDEINKKLDNSIEQPTKTPIMKHTLPRDCVWADADRLESVEAPEAKSVLVITKDADSNKNVVNQNVIEKIVMDNEIPITKSHRNNSGDIVLVCETKKDRDELKNLVNRVDDKIQMNSPNAKQIPITIVGLPKNCSNDEAIKMLVLQNQFIKKFSSVNKIEEHIKIHIIKPLKNKPSVFQIFASVSPVLREGLTIYKNKVVIGLCSCRIYDRKQVKRCYNCQKFGHIAKDCPTPNEAHCGKCSENHRTDSCSSNEKKCINCVRNNIPESDHSASYYKCPCAVKYEEDSLNSIGRTDNNRR